VPTIVTAVGLPQERSYSCGSQNHMGWGARGKAFTHVLRHASYPCGNFSDTSS